MNRRRTVIALLAALLATAAAIAPGVSNAQTDPAETPVEQDDLVRLNQIQTIGSHNSYHLLPSSEEQDLMRSLAGGLADTMQYEHRPLPVQFQSQKVRQIELDVFVDQAGGNYANPLLRTAVGHGPYLPDVMNQPGLKVFHVQDVDYVSSCNTLEACLQAVKGWSDANSEHVPLAILLELKDTTLDFGGLEFTTPEPFDAAAMDEVDRVIRSVFPADHLITPDDVRGSHSTLEDAVLTGDAWPTLAESRGKVLFLMDNGGGYRNTYLQPSPILEGRPMFTNSFPGQPDAAFIKMNDPFESDLIAERVRAGYLVRTRADGDTMEARANDTTKRDAALASGAQWVSTDYPMPDMAIGFSSSYVAQIPGGHIARCNPVNAPDACVSDGLDTIWSPEEPTDHEPPTPTPTTMPADTPPSTSRPAPAAPIVATPSYTG